MEEKIADQVMEVLDSAQNAVNEIPKMPSMKGQINVGAIALTVLGLSGIGLGIWAGVRHYKKKKYASVRMGDEANYEAFEDGDYFDDTGDETPEAAVTK